MSIFRLLPFSLMITVGLAAQSSPEKAPTAVPSTNSVQLNSSSATDPVSPSPNSGLTLPKQLDRTRIPELHPRLNEFSERHMVGTDRQSDDDTLCYTMRSFKVARDDPHSDATHAAGYSTCQAAARFQVYRTDEQVLPAKP